MLLTTDGLIIREQNANESDRLLTILTQDRGVLRAFANGARRFKNKNASSTSLLTYARFVLYEGKQKYIVNESDPKEIFFGLRSDIQKLSLSQYLCELCLHLAPEQDDAAVFLRLMLGALYRLETRKRSESLIKLTVELRLLSLTGYMPDLIMCSKCNIYEAEEMLFLIQKGSIVCRKCYEGYEPYVSLNPGALHALRHIVFSAPEKLFSFSVSENTEKILAQACESYLQSRLQYPLPTLDFYHSITGL